MVFDIPKSNVERQVAASITEEQSSQLLQGLLWHHKVPFFPYKTFSFSDFDDLTLKCPSEQTPEPINLEQMLSTVYYKQGLVPGKFTLQELKKFILNKENHFLFRLLSGEKFNFPHYDSKLVDLLDLQWKTAVEGLEKMKEINLKEFFLYEDTFKMFEKMGNSRQIAGIRKFWKDKFQETLPVIKPFHSILNFVIVVESESFSQTISHIH